MPRFHSLLLTATFLLAGLCSLTVSASAQPAAAPDPTPQRQTDLVPFVPWAHHGGPVVTVWLNDKTSARFLLDSGADGCYLSARLASEMKLPTSGTTLSMGPTTFDGLIVNRIARVDKVELGTLRFNKLDFYVLRPQSLEQYNDQPIDGLIGLTVLSKFAVFLDYSHHTAAFIYPGKLSAPETAALGFGDPQTAHVSLTQKKRDTPIMGTRILLQDALYSTHIALQNGEKKVETDIWIDTGAPLTHVHRKDAEKAGLLGGKVQGGWTEATGPRLLTRSVAPRLSIGNLAIDNMPIEFPVSSDDEDGYPALLGADVLSFCNVLFDYPGKALYLRPVLAPIAAIPTISAADTTPVDRGRLGALIRLPNFTYILHSDLFNLPESDEDRRLAAEAAEAAVTSAAEADKGRKLDELGRAYLRLGDTEHAQQTFTMAASAWQALGETHQAEMIRDLGRTPGGLTRAIEAARTLTEKSPNQPEAWAALGECLSRHAALLLTASPFSIAERGNIANAAVLETGLALRKARLSEERLRDAEDDRTEAHTCYDKAVALAPKEAAWYRERANFRLRVAMDVECPLLIARGKNVDIGKQVYTYDLRDDWEKASDLSPSNVEDLFQTISLEFMATSSQNPGDIKFRDESFWSILPDRARKAVEKRIANLEGLRKSTDPMIAARAAEAQGIIQATLLENRKHARTLFQEALEKSPEHSRLALHYLAGDLADSEDFDSLLTLLKAHVADQDTAETHLMLAHAYQSQDKDDLVLAEAGEALRCRPDHVDANLLLVTLLLRRLAVTDSTEDRTRITTGLNTLETQLKALRWDQRQKYDDARAIYLALTGQPAAAQTYALRALDESRSDTEAREILAILHPTPTALQAAEAR